MSGAMPRWVNEQQVMLDLETMGKHAGCAILSIGAVRFVPADFLSETPEEPIDEFYGRIPLADSQRAGFELDAETVLWWFEQEDEARREHVNVKGFNSPQIILPAFRTWLQKTPNVPIWAMGPSFDLAILDAAYAKLDMATPWHYRQERDVRTIQALGWFMGIEPKRRRVAHNALDDAIAQARHVSEILMALDERLGLE